MLWFRFYISVSIIKSWIFDNMKWDHESRHVYCLFGGYRKHLKFYKYKLNIFKYLTISMLINIQLMFCFCSENNNQFCQYFKHDGNRYFSGFSDKRLVWKLECLPIYCAFPLLWTCVLRYLFSIWITYQNIYTKNWHFRTFKYIQPHWVFDN